jgi:hypothetical protein
MKKILRRLKYTKWKVIRTTWPYPEGYGVYRSHRFSGRMTVLDTGLTKQQAKEVCEYENNQ